MNSSAVYMLLTAFVLLGTVLGRLGFTAQPCTLCTSVLCPAPKATDFCRTQLKDCTCTVRLPLARFLKAVRKRLLPADEIPNLLWAHGEELLGVERGLCELSVPRG